MLLYATDEADLKGDNMYDDDKEYVAAKKRIDSTPELEPYRSTIMYDWQETGEHWAWVAIAPTKDIIAWAQMVEKDQEDDEKTDEWFD